MPIGRLSPTTLLEQTGSVGSVTAIQDDPDSPNSSWITTDGLGDTVIRTAFNTPADPLTIGSSLQNFRVLVRKSSSTTKDGSVTVSLYENGVSRTSQTFTVSNSQTVLQLPWNASLLSNGTGANVECRIVGVGVYSGKGSDRFGIDIGAIEWNFDSTPLDSTPPAEVTGLAASNVGETSVTLTWNNPADSDFAKVKIYKNSTYLTELTGTSYTDNAVVDSTTYQYKVTTVDVNNNESSGSSLSVETIYVDRTPPGEVTNLSKTEQDSSITLTWSNPVDLDFSHVRILKDGVQVADNVTGATFLDSNFDSTLYYTYTLKTVDTSGNESQGKDVQAGTPPPVVTRHMLSFNGSDSKMAIPEITYTKIEIDLLIHPTQSSGTATIMAEMFTIDQASLSYYPSTTAISPTKWDATYDVKPVGVRGTITIYSPGKTIGLTVGYYTNFGGDVEFAKIDVYAIKIFNGTNVVAFYDMSTQTVNDISGNGNDATISRTSWGTYDEIDDTPPGEVTNLSETHDSSSVTLVWSPPTDSDYSHVKIRRNGLVLADDITSNQYTDTSLTGGVTYTYIIKTVDIFGNESPGVTIYATTDSPPVGPPVATIIGIETEASGYVISDEETMNIARIRFKFDVDVTEWVVNVIGSSWDTGVLADSGGFTAANDIITAEVDWTELYQEGDNRINIYGKDATGQWTPYNDDREPVGGSVKTPVFLSPTQIILV
jgi:fibronectin type 3 domain-containing protein